MSFKAFSTSFNASGVRDIILEIKVNNEQQPEFLKESDALIDACVGLLSFPKSIKIKGCLKRFLN